MTKLNKTKALQCLTKALTVKGQSLFLRLENPYIRNLKASRVEYSQGGIHDEKYQIPPCTYR